MRRACFTKKEAIGGSVLAGWAALAQEQQGPGNHTGLRHRPRGDVEDNVNREGQGA